LLFVFESNEDPASLPECQHEPRGDSRPGCPAEQRSAIFALGKSRSSCARTDSWGQLSLRGSWWNAAPHKRNTRARCHHDLCYTPADFFKSCFLCPRVI